MATRNVITTPRGRAVYPHLNAPDTKFDADGVYTIKLAIPAKAAEKIVSDLDAVQAAAIEQAKKDNPKLKKVKIADPPYTEQTSDTGEDEVVLNFKMKAQFKSKKDDSIVRMKPAIFDAKGQPLPASVRVGGGSTVRVSFEPQGFYTATVGAGVTLRLKAVQVIELREYTAQGAGSFGFEEEEGYEAPEEEALPAEEKPAEKAQSEEETTEKSDTTSASDGSDF